VRALRRERVEVRLDARVLGADAAAGIGFRFQGDQIDDTPVARVVVPGSREPFPLHSRERVDAQRHREIGKPCGREIVAIASVPGSLGKGRR